MSNGCGYLTTGWDNTVNWVVTFEYYVTGDNNGYIVIPKGTTARDTNGIQQWQNRQLHCRNNGVDCTGEISNAGLSLDTWINVEIRKTNSTTLEVYYNNNLATTFTWNECETYTTMCIGLDKDNARNSASIRNIKVVRL